MFDDHLVKTATALAAYCNAHNEAEGLDTLYHKDCVSVEALDMPGGPMGRVAEGLSEIRKKHDFWYSMNEEHDSSTRGPFMHAPDQFSLIFHMDVTNKESGERQQMDEVGLYTVDGDGKIIKEQFFYPPMG